MILCSLSISEFADIASAVSCFLAFVGLLYAGYQFKKNNETIQKSTFLNSNDRFIDLRKMIIEDDSLAKIYSEHISFENLSIKQKYYIYILISFCESLYLTDQIDIFPKQKGGNWRNFIKHTIFNPTINGVWAKETEISDSDFAKDFIDFVNKLKS